jgi:hypothetical protein
MDLISSFSSASITNLPEESLNTEVFFETLMINTGLIFTFVLSVTSPVIFCCENNETDTKRELMYRFFL